MAALSEASLFAGHSGRLLRPDVWKLHAAHLLLCLLTCLHLGEFNLGVRENCEGTYRCCLLTLLRVFFPPPRQSLRLGIDFLTRSILVLSDGYVELRNQRISCTPTM